MKNKNKLNKSEFGFGAIEGLLSLIAITLIVGVGFYMVHANDSTGSYLNNSETKRNIAAKDSVEAGSSSSSTSSPESDKDQIVAVVKNYSGAGGSQQNATVTVDSIKGDNAIGRVKSGTTADDGFAAQFIVHKGSTGWKVIYEGQQAPGSELGKKYGLPQAWYSTDY